MPIEEPSMISVLTTAAFGAGAGVYRILTSDEPTPRRVVIANVWGATLLAATVPQVITHYIGLHSVASWLLGVLCGLSAPLIISYLISFTGRWLKKKGDKIIEDLPGEEDKS